MCFAMMLFFVVYLHVLFSHLYTFIHIPIQNSLHYADYDFFGEFRLNRFGLDVIFSIEKISQQSKLVKVREEVKRGCALYSSLVSTRISGR